MDMEATLIFPHQLYLHHPLIEVGRPVYLVEDDLYFRQYAFHKQKLVLHRASMKYYEQKLNDAGMTVHYVETSKDQKSMDILFGLLQEEGIKTISFTDPTDYLLSRRLKRYSRQNEIMVDEGESPNFLCSRKQFADFFDNRKRYFMADFYTWQRKRLNLMVNGKEPWGGQWSFDEMNRKKLPAGSTVPLIPEYGDKHFIEEAINYINQHFPGNYGSIDSFKFPVTHANAETLFEDFLKNRFSIYGDYQDAMLTREPFLYHSLISSSLNIGLLDPSTVVNRAINFATENKVSLNSLEGFIRQIIGWREYIRAVYEREGVKQRKKNYFGFTNPMPRSFWDGTTGLLPVDAVITRTLEHAYAHHIERLMVLGNSMLLCEIHPDEVYQWFMTLFIDAYDWVMVPNVYGMSQFADGGLMSTKPYISGSNYLGKMSDFRKGDWNARWDGLFWKFMSTHRSLFEKNPRMSFLLNSWDKMPALKKSNHLDAANSFVEKLNSDSNLTDQLF